MAYSEAQKRASRKYNEKAYDRISLTVKKGMRDEIKEAAQKHGMSMNEFITDSIRKNM